MFLPKICNITPLSVSLIFNFGNTGFHISYITFALQYDELTDHLTDCDEVSHTQQELSLDSQTRSQQA